MMQCVCVCVCVCVCLCVCVFVCARLLCVITMGVCTVHSACVNLSLCKRFGDECGNVVCLLLFGRVRSA